MNSSYDLAGGAPALLPAADAAGRRALVGVGFGVAAAALFSVNGTVSKLVLSNGLSSLRLVEIRCAAAAVIFVLLSLALRPATLRIGRREAGLMAVYGVVGVALVQWLYLVALGRMPVSISLLIEFTAPLMVALWVKFVRRAAVRARVWAALALCIGGLAVVGQVWDGLTLDGLGVASAFAAAVSLALYLLMGEHALGSRDPFSLATWSFVAAALFWSLVQPWWTFPFATLSGSAQLFGDGPRVPLWSLVVWVVLLGTVAPFTLVLAGLSRIGATRAGLIGTLEPVLAGVVAWLVIDERLAPWQIVGGAVVLAGIVLAETSRGAHPGGPLPEGMVP